MLSLGVYWLRLALAVKPPWLLSGSINSIDKPTKVWIKGLGMIKFTVIQQ
ncbi:MAG: hypothetical protein OFPI_33150 [Osedax symbiont Rs2]|nr:MAG: hypothetical protein OFPI_33150 [Osedax symbiont Rs2]